jgi:crotonobetaine/carnitine-CoA ligase
MRWVVPSRHDWCLSELVARRGQELGDRPFLSFAFGEQELSYGAAAEAARAIAGGLTALGVGRGDRVLLMLRNRVEFTLAMLGVAEAGGVQVPVNVDYRGPFLEHLVNTSEASVLIVERELIDSVAASLGALPALRSVVVVGGAPDEGTVDLGATVQVSLFHDLLESDPAGDRQRCRSSDIAAIHFTSGTSGRSKGALMPHAAVHLLAERNRELLDIGPGDVYLTELPLFHVNAQMSVYSSLLVGARLRIERRFSASAWLERIQAAGATHTSLLGVMLGFILAQARRADDADNLLRSAWTVPCPTGPALAFRARFGLERVVTSYGSTEIGMVTHRVVGEGPDGSAGRVADDLYDVRVVDADDEELPPGEVGQLIVRPRLPWTTTLGYVGMPDAAFTAFRNLWFHTGDAVTLDADRNLTFVDRFDDRIRRRGENVASADVEGVLIGHPAIAEAAVVAVPADDEGGEDEIKAVIVPEPGAALDPEAVWGWCDERLPYFAVPRYVELAAELPKTPTSKVRKNELRAAGVGPDTVDRGGARRGGGRR